MPHRNKRGRLQWLSAFLVCGANRESGLIIHYLQWHTHVCSHFSMQPLWHLMQEMDTHHTHTHKDVSSSWIVHVQWHRLLLFIEIQKLVGRKKWKKRNNALAQALFLFQSCIWVWETKTSLHQMNPTLWLLPTCMSWCYVLQPKDKSRHKSRQVKKNTFTLSSAPRISVTARDWLAVTLKHSALTWNCFCSQTTS